MRTFGMDYPSIASHYLKVAENFNRVVSTYDEAAILQQAIGKRLLERLELLNIDPYFILDLGSGTGFCANRLAGKYKNACVLNLDIATEMLASAKKTKAVQNQAYLCANGTQLPFKPHSIDLIFSNCVLPWFAHPQQVLSEAHRVLKPGGILFFSTFGPDTLIELNNSLDNINAKTHNTDIPVLTDMHNIGDLLLQHRFCDPVVDREILTLTYQNVFGLLRDLKRTGTCLFPTNIDHPSRVNPRHALHNLSHAYESYRDTNGLLPATFEVIYGHALGPIASGLHSQDTEGVIRIPISDLHYL